MAVLRDFPYPFKTMACVSVDTDIGILIGDEHRYVRTNQTTPYGDGLGMPVWSDSFWLTYVTSQMLSGATMYSEDGITPRTGIKGHDVIKKGILAGYVNGWHGYGQFNTSLGSNSSSGSIPLTQAARDSWAKLKTDGYGWRVPAWYDHNPYAGQYNKQDFCYVQNSRKAGFGADPSSPDYHANETVGRDGVRYAWHKEYTDALYQADMDYFSDPEMSIASDVLVTGRMTVPSGQLLYPVTLLDGTKVWGFNRWTAPDRVVGQLWLSDAEFINSVGGGLRLEKLSSESGYFIHYTHYNAWTPSYLPWMKQKWDEGVILPAQQNHILDYALAYQRARWVEEPGHITVTHIADEVFGFFIPELRQVRGLTFLVDAENTSISIGTTAIPESEITRNYDVAAGKWAVGIKWHENDTTDYYAMTLPQVEALFLAESAPVYEPYTVPTFDLASAFLPQAVEIGGSAGSESSASGSVIEAAPVAGASSSSSGAGGSVAEIAPVAGRAGSASSASGSASETTGTVIAFDLASAFLPPLGGVSGSAGSDSGASGAASEVTPVTGVAGSVSGAAGSAAEVAPVAGSARSEGTSSGEVHRVAAAPLPRSAQVGVFLPGQDGTHLEEWARTVGAYPSHVLFFYDYTERPDDLVSSVNKTKLQIIKGVAGRSITPIVTLGPDFAGAGIDLDAITADDPVYTTWAQALTTIRGEVIVRWAHEMNCPGYPWARANSYGNTAAKYVAAFRRVHDLFATHAPNVKMFWCGNGDDGDGTTNQLPDYFPGDDYVDYVGVDHYNPDRPLYSGGYTASVATNMFTLDVPSEDFPFTNDSATISGAGIAGLSDTYHYWIINVDREAGTFQVSTSMGGAAKVLEADCAGTITCQGTWGTWRGPSDGLIGPYNTIANITGKPFIIGEIGTKANTQDKAAWITELFETFSRGFGHSHGLYGGDRGYFSELTEGGGIDLVVGNAVSGPFYTVKTGSYDRTTGVFDLSLGGAAGASVEFGSPVAGTFVVVETNGAHEAWSGTFSATPTGRFLANADLPHIPPMHAFCWWEVPYMSSDPNTWSINSSPEAVQAFTDGMSSLGLRQMPTMLDWYYGSVHVTAAQLGSHTITDWIFQ